MVLRSDIGCVFFFILSHLEEQFKDCAQSGKVSEPDVESSSSSSMDSLPAGVSARDFGEFIWNVF